MLTSENTAELYQLIIKNRAHLQRWFEWANHITTESDCCDFVQESVKKYRTNKAFDAGLYWDDRLVGMIGFHEINWRHKHVEIGYWISDEEQGKGLVSQSVQALMTYAFLEYKLNRVEILCATDNLRSRALAERLAFEFEGIQRAGYQLSGRFFDVACYSLLARDFQPKGDEPYVQLARQICTL